jgi:hypothetical protein
MICPKCGGQNNDNNFKCTNCQEILHPSAPPVVITSDDTLGGLIPSKNGPALGAYYLGIFSLLPLLGIPLAIAALILGFKGLRKAREHPEVKGKIHAWVGIIGGAFGLLISFGMIALLWPIPGRS